MFKIPENEGMNVIYALFPITGNPVIFQRLSTFHVCAQS